MADIVGIEYGGMKYGWDIWCLTNYKRTIGSSLSLIKLTFI